MGRPVKRKGRDAPGTAMAERKRASEASNGRRAQLTGVAANVFARKGVGNTTMRDIADEAGILAGSLYHHFVSKDALLEEILREALDELTKAYESARDAGLGAVATLERLVLVGLRFVRDRHAVTAIVQNDFTYLHDMEQFGFVDDMTAVHRRIWRSVLERGVEEGVFRSNLNLDVAYRSMMASIVVEVRFAAATRSLSVEQLAAHAHGVLPGRPEAGWPEAGRRSG